MKNSFVMYTDYLNQMEYLNMEQRGILITAIMQYVNGDEVIDMDGMTQMAFAFIKAQVDRDAEKYEEKCEKRREAGKLGGRPRKANGFSEKAKKANGFSEKQTKANESKQKQKNPDDDNDDDDDNEDDIKHTCANAQEQAFNDFWNLYPKKRSKGQAMKAWKKLNPSSKTIRAIMDKLPELIESADWKKDGGQYIPYPATWLNAAGWEDEVGNPPPSKNKFQNFDNNSYDVDAIEKALARGQAG